MVCVSAFPKAHVLKAWSPAMDEQSVDHSCITPRMDVCLQWALFWLSDI